MTTTKPLEKFVTVNNLRLRYFDWGTEGKPPMVCLHGHTGDASIWEEFAEAMSAHFHVYTVDQRGHGGSEWAKDDYDRDRYVEDLAAFVDELGLQKFTLVGLSMGGWNTLLYTPQHAERVERAIIVDIAPESSEEAREMWGSRPPTPMEFDSFENAVVWGREVDPWATDARHRRDMEAKLNQRDDGKWTWKADPALFGGRLRDNSADDLIKRYWTSLVDFICPIMEVRGAESPLVSDTIIERMVAANPKRFVHATIANAGHVVPVDQPEAFIDATREFLGVPV